MQLVPILHDGKETSGQNLKTNSFNQCFPLPSYVVLVVITYLKFENSILPEWDTLSFREIQLRFLYKANDLPRWQT